LGAAGRGLLLAILFLTSIESIPLHYALILTAVVEFFGLWLLTLKEPSPPEREPAVSLRLLLRFAAFLALIFEVAARLVPDSLYARAGIAEYSWLLPAAAFLLFLLRTIFIGLFLSHLARRLPDDVLTYRIISATSAVAVFSFFASLATLYYPVLFLNCCILLPVLPVAYLWLQVLYWQYVRDFRACAFSARKHQSSPTVAPPDTHHG
jgi:hypothetical protein